MRIPFVAGNWKMNLTRTEAVALAKKLAETPPTGSVEVAVCPAFVYLLPVAQTIGNSHVRLGAQDVYFQAKGAFTGEISCGMLLDVGCEYAIIGHSERRHVIGESDELVNAKLKATVASGLKPILCVGEKMEQRDAGKTKQVVKDQLQKGLAGLSADDLSLLVIAYEPVWAIGTGRTATPDQAQEVHDMIRSWLGENFGKDFARQVRIQYGGSVTAANAADLMAQKDVDGALVGGASLKADEFLKIIDAAGRAGS